MNGGNTQSYLGRGLTVDKDQFCFAISFFYSVLVDDRLPLSELITSSSRSHHLKK